MNLMGERGGGGALGVAKEGAGIMTSGLTTEMTTCIPTYTKISWWEQMPTPRGVPPGGGGGTQLEAGVQGVWV